MISICRSISVSVRGGVGGQLPRYWFWSQCAMQCKPNLKEQEKYFFCPLFQDCMPPSCIISFLCLEDTPSRSQRCFAVYHNNVIIYNLLNGTCVGHLKELHPREITAMLFFNPLKVQFTDFLSLLYLTKNVREMFACNSLLWLPKYDC